VICLATDYQQLRAAIVKRAAILAAEQARGDRLGKLPPPDESSVERQVRGPLAQREHCVGGLPPEPVLQQPISADVWSLTCSGVRFK